MRLTINTADADKIKLRINDKKYSLKVKKRSSQKLLPFIRKVLKTEKINIGDIDQVIVATGPGSYTGIRVGVSIAQVIAWYREISLNNKDVGKDWVPEIKYD